MYKLSIAPMLDVTDRHCRMFHRLFSSRIRLYTEMVHCGAILFGDRKRFLDFDEAEHPLALQLGGSNPEQLAKVAIIAEEAGFDEVNLNVGCPSSRVQSGGFGAALMAQPEQVAQCVGAMIRAVSIPVTVKHRLGIDDQEPCETLSSFIDIVSQAGCTEFIVHARKAWLKGLSPKDNRNIPPLDYDLVYKLADDFPDLTLCINGGIHDLEAVKYHLGHVDGVMIGRAAIDNPWMLANVHVLFDQDSAPFQSRSEIVHAYCHYIEKQLSHGAKLNQLVAPLMGLYKGEPHAKSWRRHLAQRCKDADAGTKQLIMALDMMGGQ